MAAHTGVTLEAAQEMTLVEQLIKQRTALLNQQDAFAQLPYQSKNAQNTLLTLLEELSWQIDQLEASTNEKIKNHDSTLIANLRSIPGIGPDLRCSGWAGPKQLLS